MIATARPIEESANEGPVVRIAIGGLAISPLLVLGTIAQAINGSVGTLARWTSVDSAGLNAALAEVERTAMRFHHP
jgi:hypothetical protein